MYRYILSKCYSWYTAFARTMIQKNIEVLPMFSILRAHSEIYDLRQYNAHVIFNLTF